MHPIGKLALLLLSSVAFVVPARATLIQFSIRSEWEQMLEAMTTIDFTGLGVNATVTTKSYKVPATLSTQGVTFRSYSYGKQADYTVQDLSRYSWSDTPLIFGPAQYSTTDPRQNRIDAEFLTPVLAAGFELMLYDQSAGQNFGDIQVTAGAETRTVSIADPKQRIFFGFIMDTPVTTVSVSALNLERRPLVDTVQYGTPKPPVEPEPDIDPGPDSPVPEPSTWLMIAGAALVFGSARVRKSLGIK